MKYPEGKRLLVDGDILKYRCAFAAEKTHYLVQEGRSGKFTNFDNHKDAKKLACDPDDLIWSRKEIQPVEFAINAVQTTLNSFVAKFNPSAMDVYLSDSTTFRHRLAKTKPYKGNREGTDRPKYYEEVGDYLLNQGAIILKDVEADDCLAIEATKDPEGTIILTIDKDLLQVPGNHYNWVKDEYTTQTKREATLVLAKQLLIGDSTDNIPGCPSVGPVAAARILKDCKGRMDAIQRVLEAYKQQVGEGWQDYFIEQAQLVYLLRTYEEKDDPWATKEIASLTEQVRATLQGAVGQ